jgi:hypothetical protein
VGASAIHSAEVRSGRFIFSRFVKSFCVVTFLSRISTVCLLTVTVAETRSPGLTAIRRLTGGAGNSSYQATYDGWPMLQFACVPVCSTANELREKPPSPTQNAEYVWAVSQLAVGCTQRAVTVVNFFFLTDAIA